MKMKISLHCTCGASMICTVPSEKVGAKIVMLWKNAHNGEGHAPCDEKEARKAREASELVEYEKLIGGLVI